MKEPVREATTSSRIRWWIVRDTLIFATIGLALEMLVLYGFGFNSVRELIAHWFVGVCGMYVAAGMTGWLGSIFVARSNTKKLLWVIGPSVAFACLIISTVAATSVTFFMDITGHPPIVKEPSVWKAFVDYIAFPTGIVLLFGWLPCLILGLLYAGRLRQLIGRSEMRNSLTNG